MTINCAERGLLLLRVRDEIRMTIAAYQTLYESSVAFGMRKALQAEQGKADMERKVGAYCKTRLIHVHQCVLFKSYLQLNLFNLLRDVTIFSPTSSCLSDTTFYKSLHSSKCSIICSAVTIIGLFDAAIDGGITFNALSVTIWNYSKLNPYFHPTRCMSTDFSTVFSLIFYFKILLAYPAEWTL